ncbi:MAG: 2OG-Fe(II) oxygenase [Lysobacter sp.]
MNAAVGLLTLQPGDRLPDVRLNLPDGQRVRLHSVFAGTPLWLATPATEEAARALPAPPEGIVALCIADAGGGNVPGGWRAVKPSADWSALFESDTLWQADANLRLQWSRSLPLRESLPPPVSQPTLGPAETAVIAPVLQIPGVLEPEFCDALIRHLEIDCGGGDASAVRVLQEGHEYLELDPSIKQRRESPPRDPTLEARLHERLMRRVLPEVARVYQFHVGRRDPFKLLAYPADAGYFRAHRDNETPDVAHRRFALSVNLNADAYDGGEFRFPEFGPHRFSPATGTALVFSCSLLHEVLPVERGVRYAMTTFLA